MFRNDNNEVIRSCWVVEWPRMIDGRHEVAKCLISNTAFGFLFDDWQLKKIRRLMICQIDRWFTNVSNFAWRRQSIAIIWCNGFFSHVYLHLPQLGFIKRQRRALVLGFHGEQRSRDHKRSSEGKFTTKQVFWWTSFSAFRRSSQSHHDSAKWA